MEVGEVACVDDQCQVRFLQVRVMLKEKVPDVFLVGRLLYNVGHLLIGKVKIEGLGERLLRVSGP